MPATRSSTGRYWGGGPFPQAVWRGFRLSASPFPMWIFDRVTGAVIAANDAAVHVYACTREDLLVATVWDLVQPPGRGGLRLLRAPHDVVLWTEPWMQRRRDGSEFWAEVGMIDAGDLEREATMVIVNAFSEERAPRATVTAPSAVAPIPGQ